MVETYRNLTTIDKNIQQCIKCSNAFTCTIIIVGMKKVKLERKVLHILNVLKPLHVTIIFTVIKKHILH
ncbi:hypothetical protein U0070_014701 [Myodes glareolus]|uniref:Uncharacterized protein n=1 Tax=Myodes glareolus TaxID=447135 RepID=A0AAW0H3D1_MYOGA